MASKGGTGLRVRGGLVALGAFGSIGATILGAGPASAAAAEIASFRSPDGQIRATVERSAAGELTLSASLDGREIIAPSPLGLELEGMDLTRGLEVDRVSEEGIRGTFSTPTGARRRHLFESSGSVIQLEPKAGGPRLEIDFQATDDGVAYRYRLRGGKSATVLSEASGFEIAGATTAFTAPHSPNGESLWGGPSERTIFAQPNEVLLPALVQQGAGRYALIAEAGVDASYAGSHLLADPLDAGRYSYLLPRASETTAQGPMESGDPLPVEVELPFASPWRVAVLGDAGTIATTDMLNGLAVLQLGTKRFDWVRPGHAAWSWLTENASPGDFDRQRSYIDFAAANDWPYVVVDEGWRDVQRDVPALVRYARERGVGIVLWLNKRELDTPEERRRDFALFERWGVEGLKVDFFDDETQATMRLVETIARAAARREIVLNLHGFGVPRGIQLEWPNIVTFEGVRGAEYYYLSEDFAGLVPAPNPEHNTILPFTRQPMGPMDYTPVTFETPNRITGDAHELALAVVQESGILHPADSIEAYEQRPNVTAMLGGMPTAWRGIRFIEGAPGRSITIARRARRGSWWIGSINAGAARTVTVPLRFLAKGKWATTIAVEAPGPDVGLRTKLVDRRDVLRLEQEANGGSVVRLVRKGG